MCPEVKTQRWAWRPKCPLRVSRNELRHPRLHTRAQTGSESWWPTVPTRLIWLDTWRHKLALSTLSSCFALARMMRSANSADVLRTTAEGGCVKETWSCRMCKPNGSLLHGWQSCANGRGQSSKRNRRTRSVECVDAVTHEPLKRSVGPAGMVNVRKLKAAGSGRKLKLRLPMSTASNACWSLLENAR